MQLINTSIKTNADESIRLIQSKLCNDGDADIAINGVKISIGSFNPHLAKILVYRSEWGREFSPQWYNAGERELSFGSYQGRCSHGYSPFIYFVESSGIVHCAAICWSGNWQIDIAQNGDIEMVLTPQMLSLTLNKGQTLTLPSVVFSSDINGVKSLCEKTSQWLEENWFKQSRVPIGTVEWNHWWTYEDVEITEDIFLANAVKAKELGVTLCTLDAGWFGDADSPSHWTQCRGDWEIVNKVRFPHGLKWLSKQIHDMGMLFGIWLEPEALGEKSKLFETHPEWRPLRDGRWDKESYLCLASNGAATWLFETIDNIIADIECDWIKLDFNVDPGFGCNRAQHGHQPDMGLYNHYLAYYNILDKLRDKYPKLVLENCSSGGLRLDLEMLRHTDLSFISDPDELSHSLQCFYGASMLIPSHRLLHWTPSQTRLYQDGTRAFDTFVIDNNTNEAVVRASLRSGMLHQLGICRDLPNLPKRAIEIFKEEIRMYKTEISPIMPECKIIRFTNQPMRDPMRADDERLLALCPFAEDEEKDIAAFGLITATKGFLLAFSLKNKSGVAVMPITGLLANCRYSAIDKDTNRKWNFDSDINGLATLAVPVYAGASAVIMYNKGEYYD